MPIDTAAKRLAALIAADEAADLLPRPDGSVADVDRATSVGFYVLSAVSPPPTPTNWRWTFYDPTTAETYRFEINPLSGGTRAWQRQLTTISRAAATAGSILFEGAPPPRTLALSGVIRSQTHYDAWVSWAQRKHQIKMTDDLGREQWVVVLNFKPKREGRRAAPWRHTFEAELVEVYIP